MGIALLCRQTKKFGLNRYARPGGCPGLLRLQSRHCFIGFGVVHRRGAFPQPGAHHHANGEQQDQHDQSHSPARRRHGATVTLITQHCQREPTQAAERYKNNSSNPCRGASFDHDLRVGQGRFSRGCGNPLFSWPDAICSAGLTVRSAHCRGMAYFTYPQGLQIPHTGCPFAGMSWRHHYR